MDDEEDIVHVLKYYLEKAGYGVNAFTSPVDALKHFAENHTRCSLFVSDVKMPQMSGYELARKVKKIKPDVKILFMTAFEIAQPEFDHMLSLGEIDGIIKKPFSSEKFIEAVESHLA